MIPRRWTLLATPLAIMASASAALAFCYNLQGVVCCANYSHTCTLGSQHWKCTDVSDLPGGCLIQVAVTATMIGENSYTSGETICECTRVVRSCGSSAGECNILGNQGIECPTTILNGTACSP